MKLKKSVEFKVDKHIFPKFSQIFCPPKKKNQQNVFEKNHCLVLISSVKELKPVGL